MAELSIYCVSADIDESLGCVVNQLSGEKEVSVLPEPVKHLGSMQVLSPGL